MSSTQDRSINRYYDPATAAFLSIDSNVGQSNQPYEFTNDNSLNATDPAGLLASTGTTETDAEVAEIAAATKSSRAIAAKVSVVIHKATTQTLTKVLVRAIQSQGVTISSTAADTISRTLSQVTANPNNPITQSGEGDIVGDVIQGTGDFATAVSISSSLVTTYNDIQEGHDEAYSLGESAAQLGGAWAGAAGAAAACSETLDPLFIAFCGAGGGALAALGIHIAWHKLIP